MLRCFVSCVFLASLCGAAALKIGTDDASSISNKTVTSTVIEVELYHMGFGAHRVTREAVKLWADKNIKRMTTLMQTMLDSKPKKKGKGHPAVKVSGVVVQKASETRLGGSEEVCLDFNVQSMAPDAFDEKLRGSVKTTIMASGGDFGGASVQEPVYKPGETQNSSSSVQIDPVTGLPAVHKRRLRRDEAASGRGDPHLTNIHGEHFDLYKTGNQVLIQIPRMERPQDAMLRVEAQAVHIGPACADLYFQVVNITGKWTKKSDGVQYFAEQELPKMNWTRYGEVEMKVVWGHLKEGTVYLNFFVKHLGHVSFPVGGLLGEDDHTEAATPGPWCATDLDLHADSSDVVLDERTGAQPDADSLDGDTASHAEVSTED